MNCIQTIMIRGDDYGHIPMDLLPEIFSKLPEKSIARFRCVSKLCRSMPIRPRLLFALQRANNEFLIFSSSQPHQKPYEKSLVVSADFHTKISKDEGIDCCGLASRLIYFSSQRCWDPKPLIYNPITRQYMRLPEVKTYRRWYSFLGFDPIDKQFKVLFIAYPFFHHMEEYRIMTLKYGRMRWRKIKCSLAHYHYPLGEGICINGVLYYFCETVTHEDSYEIVCFDIRSEKFKFVDAKCCSPSTTKLINHKGNIGAIELTYDDDDDDDAVVLTMWVLEDANKPKWSKFVYTLPKFEVFVSDVFVVGMTSTGDIVLSDKHTSKPFYVFYFNPERNTLQTVEVRGVGEYSEAFESDCKLYAFVDYVVDSKFIT